MRIEILSYQEQNALLDAESAMKPDKDKYTFKRWAKKRAQLIDLLSKQWVPDSTGYGKGDFYVGEDWFETGALHLVLLNWQALSTDLITGCQSFFRNLNEDYLITIGKNLSAPSDYDFEIVLTKTRSSMSIFNKDEKEVRAILESDVSFAEIKSLIADHRK